jgi:hypothetical protein
MYSFQPKVDEESLMSFNVGVTIAHVREFDQSDIPAHLGCSVRAMEAKKR